MLCNPYSAQRVEELELSVWGVILQTDEREYKGMVYMAVVILALVAYGLETCVVKTAQDNKLEFAQMPVLP